MKQILDELKIGVVHPDITSTLATRLTRIAALRNHAWHDEFAQVASNQLLGDIAKTLMDSTNPNQINAAIYATL